MQTVSIIGFSRFASTSGYPGRWQFLPQCRVFVGVAFSDTSSIFSQQQGCLKNLLKNCCSKMMPFQRKKGGQIQLCILNYSYIPPLILGPGNAYINPEHETVLLWELLISFSYALSRIAFTQFAERSSRLVSLPFRIRINEDQ